jgi:hypothetical protein
LQQLEHAAAIEPRERPVTEGGKRLPIRARGAGWKS